MSDLVSLELLFDDATEARIRDEWRALQELGVSSMGAHASASNRPHLSLLVRAASADGSGGVEREGPSSVAGKPGPGGPPLLDVDAVRDAASRLPLPVTLGGPQLFLHGTRTVLVRSVVPSRGLLEFQAEVHMLAGAAEIGRDLPHTTPGSWVPHVTLARRLQLADLERALSVLDLAPLHAMATDLRLWDARSGTALGLRGG